MVPGGAIAAIGVHPRLKRRLKIADGTVINRPAAVVEVNLRGETLPTLCVFGPEGSEPLLGAVTLERIDLGVDPINTTLVPVTSLLL